MKGFNEKSAMVRIVWEFLGREARRVVLRILLWRWEAVGDVLVGIIERI